MSTLKNPLVVILAAGAGTRMKSDLSKVLHPIGSTPLLGHVISAVQGMGVAQPEIVVVVGHQRESVVEYLSMNHPEVRTAVQAEQNGTGHAMRCALAAAPAGDDSRTVIVVAGDTPLLRGSTLAALVGRHLDQGCAATVLTAELADPSGYGRIVRDEQGDVLGIVEHKDATPEQLAITEINSGMFAFELGPLVASLARLTTDNSQGEEYLTDVLGILNDDGKRVSAYLTDEPDEINGINDRVQLAAARAIMRDRINEAHMRAGITILDPDTVWIDPTVTLGQDVTIWPNSHLLGATSVASGATVGPDTTLSNCTIGEGAAVIRSHCLDATIGPDAEIGPFTYLRPGTVLGTSAKAGAFVEIKNSSVGDNSKVPHLSYVGDAEIGSGTNVGAATIVVNYDGVNKHRTTIGDNVRVGSDSMLIAPVSIGDNAYTAAGSVITEDVPEGALAVGRARQTNVEGWVAKNRPASESH